jgi:hypothetical protein
LTVDDIGTESHLLKTERVRKLKDHVPDSIDFDWSNPAPQLIRYSAQALNNMSNVTKCVWHHRVDQPVRFNPDWPPFSPVLRELELIIFLDAKERITLDLSSAHFPSLRDLSIVVFPWPIGATSNPAALDDLAPFVSRLQPTLRRLRLWTLNIDLDGAPFLDNLGIFPLLAELEINLRIGAHIGDTHTRPAINRFITRHAGSLKSFVFGASNLNNPPEADKYNMEQIRNIFSFGHSYKPSLQKLVLCVGFPCVTIHTTCIFPFANTLTTLDLRFHEFNIHGLHVLLNCFSQSPGLLKSVKLEVNEISPQVLDAMALGWHGLALKASACLFLPSQMANRTPLEGTAQT